MSKVQQGLKETDVNNLYLPFQWMDKNQDGSMLKADGSLDRSEIWIHPELQALNAYLSETGVAPIDVKLFVDAATSYLKAEDKSQFGNPMLIQDIASRRRMRFSKDIDDIKDGAYRGAVKAMVKAGALVQIYFNLQRDPNWIEQLKSVLATGDYVKIRHFWQNKGGECISHALSDQPECSSLAAGVKKDPNGIWWPDSWTEDDVKLLRTDEVIKDPQLKRKVFTPATLIVACKKGDLDFFEFKGVYYRPVSLNNSKVLSTLSGMISVHVKKAAEFLKKVDAQYASLLDEMASYLVGDHLFADPKLDTKWAKTDNPEITSAFGNIEYYKALGSPFGVKALMQLILGYINPELQKYVHGAGDKIVETDNVLWHLLDGVISIKRRVPEAPVVNVADLVFASGAMSFGGYVPGGFNEPNGGIAYSEDVSVPKKMVYFGNIIAARIQNQGVPVAEAAFDVETQKSLSAVIPNISAIVTFIQAHEFAHSHIVEIGEDVEFLSPDGSVAKRVNLQELYGADESTAFEEMKSDLIGLYNLQTYEKLGLISSEVRIEAEKVQFANMLRNLYLGKKDGHGRGGIVTLYYFMKYDIATYNKDTMKYSLDQKKLEERLPDLMKDLMETYLSGNPAKIQKMIELANRFIETGDLVLINEEGKEQLVLKAKALAEYLAEVQKRGLPEDNLPYYMPIGDLGAY